MTSEPILLSGTAHPALASMVARQLGIAVAPCRIERSPDGEIAIELRESVRRREVFILQPISPPVSDHLIELVAMADACRRAAADRLVAVIPYFALGSVAMPMLTAAGISQVLRVDRFDALPLMATALQPMLPLDVVVVAPDRGVLPLAGRYALSLGAPVVAFDRRNRAAAGVEGRPCVVVDDVIGTAGATISTVEALLAIGAAPDITIAATHAVFRDDTREKLDLIDEISRVVVTDSVPRPETSWMKLRIVSVAPLLAEAIRKATSSSPLTKVFEAEPYLATSLT